MCGGFGSCQGGQPDGATGAKVAPPRKDLTIKRDLITANDTTALPFPN